MVNWNLTESTEASVAASSGYVDDLQFPATLEGGAQFLGGPAGEHMHFQEALNV